MCADTVRDHPRTVPLAVCIIIGLLVAADAVMPAVPAEVVVVGATTRLVDDPASASALVGVVALGAFAGQSAVFIATRRLARRWLYGHDKWWRHVGPNSAVGRWGPRALLVAGFLPGGRLAAAASVGASDARGRRFAVAAAIGSTLGATYLVALGATAQQLFGRSVGATAASVLAVALLGCTAGCALAAASPSARARLRGPGVEKGSRAAAGTSTLTAVNGGPDLGAPVESARSK